MAVLEFNFVANGLNGLTNNLNNLQNQLNNINRNSNININTGNSSRNLNVASDSVLGLRNRLNELLRTYGSLSEAQRNNARVQNNLVPEINRLREAVVQANREYDNLRRGSGRPIPSDSIVGTRTRLNELRAVYDRLSESQRNSARVQNNLVNEINRLNRAVSSAEQATGRYQRNVGNYQQAMTGANGVTMEFNRIIQDAPFGMMGIGNNIQQLAANWQTYTEQAKAAAAANGTTVTSMSLMKGAFSALLSPINLLTLGIAAVTSGWVMYEKWQQKANKATKEGKSEIDKIRESMNVYQQTQSNSINNYAQEISKLQVLYKVATSNTESTKSRTNALRQLQELYPKVFSNLDLESIKTDKVASKYNLLRSNILAAAKAQAAFSKIGELAGEDFALDTEYKRLNREYDRLNKMYDVINNRIKSAKSQGVFAGSDVGLQGLYQQLDLIDSKMNDISNQGVKINNQRKNNLNQQNELSKYAVTQQEDLIDLTGKEKKEREKVVKNLKDQRDYLLEIQQILQNSQSRVDTSGEILNWDKELIKVHDYYDSQNLALDKMLVNSQRAYKDDSAKRQQIEQAINSTKITLYNNMINELSKIDDKYFSEGMAKVAELNAKYSDSMDLDTRSNALKKVVDEFAKLREEFKNDPIISQEMLDKWQENQTLKVNWEFDNKDLEEWGKLNDRIQETIDKPFSGQNTRSIQAELEKRIAMLKKLLEQLSRATGQPFDQAEFDRLSTELKNKSTEKYNTEQAKKDIQDYVTIANNGLNSVFTNLKSNIDEFGLKARSVFYTLGETLGDLIKQLANKNTAKFMEQLTKDAKSFSDLKDNWKNMSSQDKWSAGLGFAGSAVSSLTPQTSSGGQAVGGALSGAAAGMAFGPWGAAIGAVAGGVSGLLKASKNRRQEKILQKQYEEQKKANALLERMNALTYASQIIGQKTEYGIVSGVRRNEFGQIVSVVQGQDIIMVADRTNKQKGR